MTKLNKVEANITPELAAAVREMSKDKKQSISKIIESSLRSYRPLKQYSQDIPSDRPETRGRPRKETGT